jgi:hypothetical protein
LTCIRTRYWSRRSTGIERHGRMRGGAGNLEMGICPGKAIHLAADGDFYGAGKACLALQETIKLSGSPYSGIPEWNDYIASDEDVIAAFRRAIEATAPTAALQSRANRRTFAQPMHEGLDAASERNPASRRPCQVCGAVRSYAGSRPGGTAFPAPKRTNRNRHLCMNLRTLEGASSDAPRRSAKGLGEILR